MSTGATEDFVEFIDVGEAFEAAGGEFGFLAAGDEAVEFLRGEFVEFSTAGFAVLDDGLGTEVGAEFIVGDQADAVGDLDDFFEVVGGGGATLEREYAFVVLGEGAVDVALINSEDGDEEGIFDEELDGFEDFDDGFGGTAIKVVDVQEPIPLIIK